MTVSETDYDFTFSEAYDDAYAVYTSDEEVSAMSMDEGDEVTILLTDDGGSLTIVSSGSVLDFTWDEE